MRMGHTMISTAWAVLTLWSILPTSYVTKDTVCEFARSTYSSTSLYVREPMPIGTSLFIDTIVIRFDEKNRVSVSESWLMDLSLKHWSIDFYLSGRFVRHW